MYQIGLSLACQTDTVFISAVNTTAWEVQTGFHGITTLLRRLKALLKRLQQWSDGREPTMWTNQTMCREKVWDVQRKSKARHLWVLGKLRRDRMCLRASKDHISLANKAPGESKAKQETDHVLVNLVTSTVCWSVPAYICVSSSSFHSCYWTSRELEPSASAEPAPHGQLFRSLTYCFYCLGLQPKATSASLYPLLHSAWDPDG